MNKTLSSNGYGKKTRRTESLRQKGQKPNGGQPGHKGHTLVASDIPDKTTVHEVEQCESCQIPLKELSASAYEERQVFDIPAIHIEVTAHRAEIKICPKCGHENQGNFPKNVNNTVQYGNGVNAWASYFTNQHFIPIERTAQIFEDLVNHRVSEATILKATNELSESVLPANEAIKEQLRQSEVLNLDESGLRVKSKLHWLHVASNDKLTHYEIHTKRGTEAMDAAGIISNFKGTATHDHWKPYFKYEDCNHSLCNAHHLRELKFIEKQYSQLWPKKFAALLLEIKDVVETNPDEQLPLLKVKVFEQRYDEIVKEGFDANPCPAPKYKYTSSKKRGPPKNLPPVNLLNRLKNFKPQVFYVRLSCAV